MAYMAQQWVESAAREAYRGRADALDQSAEAARVGAWLRSLPLDDSTIAALAEPIAALEEGMRQAASLRVDGAPAPGGADPPAPPEPG